MIRLSSDQRAVPAVIVRRVDSQLLAGRNRTAMRNQRLDAYPVSTIG